MVYGLFFNADLLWYYIYEKYYIDDSTTDNTTSALWSFIFVVCINKTISPEL